MYFPDNEDKYLELAEKWVNGTITSQEKQEFSEWYNANQDNIVLMSPSFAANEEVLRERMLENIHARMEKDTRQLPARRHSLNWAAAAILLFLSGGIWYYFHLRPTAMPSLAATTTGPSKNHLLPSRDKAVLTLADGSTVILDTARNGSSIQQGNTKIIVLNTGQLAYNAYSAKTGAEVLYNSISTPKGGQYQLILSDGTKVWLNAVSSLRFPTSFTGNQRNVELSGEAYFEVAKNPARPFNVRVNDLNVQVLGTHFNLMAYTDESAVKTTLLEGSVKVTKGAMTGLLTPGKQAIFNKTAGSIKIADADEESAVAWKNGLFQFNNEDITIIMREIARWYDAEISFTGNMVNKNFTGVVPRSADITQVLKMMELTSGIHFKIEGKKIIVLP